MSGARKRKAGSFSQANEHKAMRTNKNRGAAMPLNRTHVEEDVNRTNEAHWDAAVKEYGSFFSLKQQKTADELETLLNDLEAKEEADAREAAETRNRWRRGENVDADTGVVGWQKADADAYAAADENAGSDERDDCEPMLYGYVFFSEIGKDGLMNAILHSDVLSSLHENVPNMEMPRFSQINLLSTSDTMEPVFVFFTAVSRNASIITTFFDSFNKVLGQIPSGTGKAPVIYFAQPGIPASLEDRMTSAGMSLRDLLTSWWWNGFQTALQTTTAVRAEAAGDAVVAELLKADAATATAAAAAGTTTKKQDANDEETQEQAMAQAENIAAQINGQLKEQEDEYEPAEA